MAVNVKRLSAYEDDNGNKIEFKGVIEHNVNIVFRGVNNRLVVHEGFATASLTVTFDCNDAVCTLGENTFRGFIRVGESCVLSIGRGVTCTDNAYISTAEHSSLSIGDDCMIAASVQIRADDAHPIFCVKSGERLNLPEPVIIGNHVWIGARAAILGGTSIGDGSIIGFGSIVKGVFPNNCIVAGTPARLIRKDVAWERPHLTLSKPFFKPDASAVEKSVYWNLTSES
ncbi:acyltransferase [Pseudomonas sp. CM27]|uniref:acyltransferase n=1 Tax=Pseudomonas sp. CM27 TaxID=2738452 RepID=UPI0015570206|nr:acyltransferase [Pseudomonas sp. CM27]